VCDKTTKPLAIRVASVTAIRGTERERNIPRSGLRRTKKRNSGEVRNRRAHSNYVATHVLTCGMPCHGTDPCCRLSLVWPWPAVLMYVMALNTQRVKERESLRSLDSQWTSHDPHDNHHREGGQQSRWATSTWTCCYRRRGTRHVICDTSSATRRRCAELPAGCLAMPRCSALVAPGRRRKLGGTPTRFSHTVVGCCSRSGGRIRRGYCRPP
jgi:hypothetical protein